MTITRRDFLKSSIITTTVAAGASGFPRAALSNGTVALTPGPCNKWPGRVAINFNKHAVENLTQPQEDIIKKMVDDAIKELAGKSTLGDAWKEIFPASLTLQSKIAIKINTANQSLPAPHWVSVRAITDGLQQMTIDGEKFSPANIKIYDMDFRDGMKKLGYIKTNFPGIALQYTKLTDGGDGAMNNHQYASVLKDADFLINVFSPRGHTYPPAGSRFTLGFKSHVGTYASEASKEGPSLHDTLLENLREMNCTGPVYTKNVLSVCSGIFGMNEGNGPPGEADDYSTYAKSMDASVAGRANSTTIILGTDPISVEMQSIKMMRINNSGKYAAEDLPPYLQASAGITGKMEGTTYNIGIIDESEMDVRRVINDVTAVRSKKNEKGALGQASILVLPLRDKNSTFIEFVVPPQKKAAYAAVAIYTAEGALVKRKRIAVTGIRNHFSWDHRAAGGKKVGKSAYIVTISYGAIRLAKDFMVL